MPNQEVKICSCGAPMVKREGTNKQTGNKFLFWGCSNYPDCTHTERIISTAGQQQRHEEVMKALRELYILLDKRLPKI